jgi:putative ABC transport system permease protein
MNYLKIAWRNLKTNKGFTFIYILGLSIGLAVVIVDGLWIRDELSFNKYHKNYDRIAQVMNHDLINGERLSLVWNPVHLGDLLKTEFGSDFKHIIMSTYPGPHVLTFQDKKFSEQGNYMDQDAPEMLGLEMIKGSQQGLKNIYTILLSERLARSLFGNKDPINSVVRLDNQADVKVAGVYKDLPFNSDFKSLSFIASWDLYLALNPGIKSGNPWYNNNYLTYVQIEDRGNFKLISDKIRDIEKNNRPKSEVDPYKTVFFLQPMAKWHLYSEFKNGVNTGGRIEWVWLFGAVGLFILLLACINFINLSTANSQRRAKEIGIRKTIGSLRYQLFIQFLTESTLIVVLSNIVSLIIALAVLPFFNELTDKSLSIPWGSPVFWFIFLFTVLVTGALAGLYPALYLSSFKPVKVLKGEFRFGRLAIFQRKSLLIFQYGISVVLIICTLVIYQQIGFAKNRSVGYQFKHLITFPISPEINSHFYAFRDELIKSGTVIEMAKSANPTIDYYISDGRIKWTGMDPNLPYSFPISNVTTEYGKTIGWQIKEGRDFSNSVISDSSAFILNNAAIKFMGFKDPIGRTIDWNGKSFHIIGVVNDIIFESPYGTVQPYIYQMTGDQSYFVTASLNSQIGISHSLELFKKTFEKYSPALPFDFQFVDREYSKRFGEEDRLGKLASVFSILAISISCLGIFGLATLMASQRIREIGIRKVLGSSIYNLWRLLSGDFIKLAFISLFIASPIAYYFIHRWLQSYPYHIEISWLVFAVTGLGLIGITLLTISFQIIKAAYKNPVNILRAE